MQIKELTIPIYEQPLTLIKSNSIESVQEYFETIGFDFEKDELFAHTLRWKRDVNGLDYSCIYVVLNDENKYRKLTMGVIAHEIFHVVELTFDRVGADLSIENPEPQAYLAQWVGDQIENFLNDENTNNSSSNNKRNRKS